MFKKELSRRDFFKLAGLGLLGLAGCTPTGQAIIKATSTSPAQTSYLENVPYVDSNDPHQVLSILADKSIMNKFQLDIYSQPVPSDNADFVQPHPSAYMPFEELQAELEKAIHDELNYAVRMKQIVPGHEGWQEIYIQNLKSLGDKAFFEYKQTMGLNSAKITARLGIALTPADMLFDLGDLVRGELAGKDVFGYPVNDFDRALNSASVLLALVSLDGGDDANDIARAVKYAATNGGDDIIYVTRTGDVMKLTGNLEGAVDIAKLQDVAVETIQNAVKEGNLVVDLGTGTKVGTLSVGDALKNVPGTPTLLTIDPSAAAWRKIADNPLGYIEQVQTSVVGGQDAVSSLVEAAKNAPYVRASFPNRNLMAMCLNPTELSQFAAYGSKFQATYNLTPLLRTFEFGNAPLDLARHLYGVNDIQNVLRSADMFEDGADAARASQILGDFVKNQRPRLLQGGVDYIGPQYEQFVDAVTSGNHIPDYFESLNVPGLRTARLLNLEEAAKLNTHFASLTQSGAETLPQYLVEIIP